MPKTENTPDKESSQVKTAQDTTPVPDKAEKTLFSWKAPSRPFQKRSREYWVTVISISSLLAFILFLAEGLMPVILIVSLVFLYYVMSTVNPEDVEYVITNKGVKIAENTMPWESFLQFWFIKRSGSDMLVIETPSFPFRLEFVVEAKDMGKIRDILKKYVTEGEATPTYLDKTVNWMAKKLPTK